MQDAWLMALAGGGLIGIAATIHLLVNGRIAGVSGILFGAMKPAAGEFLWRFKFLLGLVLGGVLGLLLVDQPFLNESGRPLWMVIVAGFLVGFGTKLGSGCTSGHGVCGISRMSPRSLVATVVFITAGVVIVQVARLLLGGGA